MSKVNNNANNADMHTVPHTIPTSLKPSADSSKEKEEEKEKKPYQVIEYVKSTDTLEEIPAKIRVESPDYVIGAWKKDSRYSSINYGDSCTRAGWRYQLGYINEWITQERMKLYFESLGINVKSVIKRTEKGWVIDEFSGKYKNKSFDVSISSESIYIKYMSKNETTFTSLSEIIKTFLFEGYNPTDVKSFLKIIRHYTPTRMETEENESWYSDGEYIY